MSTDLKLLLEELLIHIVNSTNELQYVFIPETDAANADATNVAFGIIYDYHSISNNVLVLLTETGEFSISIGGIDKYVTLDISNPHSIDEIISVVQEHFKYLNKIGENNVK